MNLLPMVIEQNRLVMCPHPFTMERVSGYVSYGLTIREILDVKGINVNYGVTARVLVEDLIIPEMLWDVYRPLPGSLIIIRAVPMGGDGDGKSVIRAVLMIAVVAFAMWYAGPALAGMMNLASGSAGAYAVSVGLAMVGSMLLNALIPPPSQKLDDRTGLDMTRSPSLSGTSNQINKYGPIPKILGKHKIIPPFATEPYTSFKGNDQYLHLLFCIGYGPLLIEDLKIGDTLLTEFDDVYYEVRQGYDDDDPVNITWTVHEEALSVLLKSVDGYQIRTTSEDVDEFSVDLVCPTGMIEVTKEGKKLVRDVYFEIQYAPTGTSDWSVGGSGFEDVFESFVAQESSIMSAPAYPIHPEEPTLISSRIDVVCLDSFTGVQKTFFGPAGLGTEGSTVGLLWPIIPNGYFRLAYVLRQAGDTTIESNRVWDIRTWDTTYFQYDTDFAPSVQSPTSTKIDIAAGYLRTTNRMRGKSPTTLRKTVTFKVANGQYDVRIKRVTEDATSDLIYDEVYWTAIRSIFYEDPILLDNIASIYLEIRATEQLNGMIQNFSCIATSIIPDWTGAIWQDQVTNNPASIYREILQGLGNNRPLANDRIDLVSLQTWHDNCITNGFTYNQPIDFRSSIEDMLREVAAAGRAGLSYIDGKYSIIEDIEQTTPVQHFSPRNSWGFASDKRFVEMPHGFRCLFVNEDKDYVEDERVVYDDGYTEANATDFEMLQLSGVTESDLIWKHGRYHIASARLRPETYSWYADVENIICTRGDLVRVAHDVPLWGVAWGRVKILQVDNGNTTGVTMDEEMPMELGESYCIRFRKADGTSVLCNVVLNAGTPMTIVFETAITTASGPAVGDLGLFGKQGSESIECIVKNIEPGPELSARIVAVDAAAAIYTSDTGEILSWDSQITLPFDPFNAIGLPIIDNIRSDETVLIRQIDGSLAPRILITFLYSSAFMFSYVDVIEIEYRISDTDDPWEHTEIPVTISEASLIHVESGSSYDVRCRYRLHDKRVGVWALREDYLVIGLSSLPPDVEWLMINNMLLTWKYPTVPLDWAGFELRYHNGRLNQSWESAHKVQDGLITTTSYDVTAIGIYEKTFLLKAIDIAGNYSENTAILITDLGDPLVENLMESTDYEALGFPGEITNGSVIGDDIVAQDSGGGIWDEDLDFITDEAGSIIVDETAGSFLWSDDDSAHWSKDDSAFLWLGVYAPLLYQLEFVPVLVDPDSGVTYSNPSMFLTYEFEGVSPFIEYKGNGESLFWSDSDSLSMWANPGSNLLLNPGFETDDPPADWTAGNDADLDRHADPNTGTYCLEINEGGTDDPFGYQTVAVETDKYYTFSVYIKKGTSSGSWRVSFYDLQNAQTIQPAVYGTATENYTKMSHRFLIPVGCTSILAVLYSYVDAASGLTLLFDDVSLQKDNDSNMWNPASDDWKDWPSSISGLKRQKYHFLISIQGGRIQGKVKELVVNVDVPDVEETLEDVSIATIGTRLLPVNTYINIKIVNMTLQYDAGTAMSLVAIDKLRTGPLIEAYTEGGVNTTAIIDARIQGY